MSACHFSCGMHCHFVVWWPFALLLYDWHGIVYCNLHFSAGRWYRQSSPDHCFHYHLIQYPLSPLTAVKHQHLDSRHSIPYFHPWLRQIVEWPTCYICSQKKEVKMLVVAMGLEVVFGNCCATIVSYMLSWFPMQAEVAPLTGCWSECKWKF